MDMTVMATLGFKCLSVVFLLKQNNCTTYIFNKRKLQEFGAHGLIYVGFPDINTVSQ